jgi:hypothetical protein
MMFRRSLGEPIESLADEMISDLQHQVSDLRLSLGEEQRRSQSLVRERAGLKCVLLVTAAAARTRRASSVAPPATPPGHQTASSHAHADTPTLVPGELASPMPLTPVVPAASAVIADLEARLAEAVRMREALLHRCDTLHEQYQASAARDQAVWEKRVRGW